METHLTELTGEISRLIAKTLLVEVDSPEDDLLSSGIVDSLTLVQLLVSLEDYYGLQIPLQDLEIDDLRSISSLARLVNSRQPGYASVAELA
jgi:acyl carrier protein